MTLTEFLLARIAEDEAAAASGARFESWNRSWDTTPTRDLVINGARVAAIPMDYDEHIARWDPARVLAECEAKRRIVERAQHAQSAQAAGVINPASIATEIAWTDTLRLLAAVYADHPDYDPTWRP